MKAIQLLLLIILLVTNTYAGRLMDTDFASEAELISRGASKVQLLNTSKIYDTAKDDTLNNILDQGTAVTDDLYDLVGVPAGSTDLGSFTGSTIPDDSTAKEALQALETAGESLSDDVSLLDTEAVKITGDQSVGGVKTFTGKIKTTSTINGNSPCPPMNQTQIDALTGEGTSDCVFNTTTGNLNVFDGTVWKSAGGGLSMWEEGKVFNLDDVVVYNDAIYKCVTAHTSSSSFDSLNWKLISGDSLLLNGSSTIHAKKIEFDKIIETSSGTYKIEPDQDNLFINGGFEAQDVTLGWVKSVNTSIDFITSGVFEGKKSRAIRFGGTVANYRSEANRPEYIGRQARAEIYYKSDITWSTNIPEICVYAGTSSNVVSGTCEKLQNTGAQWYPYQKGFFWSEAVMGLVIRNNGAVDLLNSVYLDKASIKLDKNEGFVANIEGDYQGEILRLNNNTFTQTTDLSSIPVISSNSNSAIYTKSTQGITLLRDAHIRASINIANDAGAGNRNTSVFVNGVVAQYNSVNTNAFGITSFVDQELPAGTKITFSATGGFSGQGSIQISATARSQVTVFPDETFSTDINPVYWKATQCLSTEIGCYNTFAFTLNTASTKTICGTRPDQSDADVRLNGFKIFTRIRSTAPSCAQPSRIELILGVGHSNHLPFIYKNAGKSISGRVTYSTAYASGVYASGLYQHSYDPLTGKAIYDAGTTEAPLVANSFTYEDGSSATSGYLVIKASKTGLGMANVPMRYPLTEVVNPAGKAIVYNDGWVEYKLSVTGSTGLVTATLPVALSSVAGNTLNASAHPTIDDSSHIWATARIASTTTVRFLTGYTNPASGVTVALGYPASITISGWGASSVVKQYGAKPAY